MKQQNRRKKHLPIDSSTTTGIEEAVAKMSISSRSKVQPFDLSIKFPYLSYDYIENGRRHFCVDFLVIGASKDIFRPKVSKDGTELQIGMVLPNIFVDEARLLAAHNSVAHFSQNTNKATAFLAVTASVTNSLVDGEAFLATPMKLTLPFKVEEEISEWEILAFSNDDKKWREEVGLPQYYFMLAVDLVGVEKIKVARKSGGFQVFKSDDDDGDDGGGAGDCDGMES